MHKIQKVVQMVTQIKTTQAIVNTHNLLHSQRYISNVTKITNSTEWTICTMTIE